MDAVLAKHEIDHHTLKLIVGVIALSLAGVTATFSSVPIESISASYHEGGWARDMFVGSLFAVSAFMMAYNGYSRREMSLSKVAAVAALGVALFPCGCGGHPEPVPFVHYSSAAVLFSVLAIFCAFFRRRASTKPSPQARVRAALYGVCGVTIVLVLVVLAGDYLSGGAISARITRLVFYGEATALTAFGVSWLIASRTLPLVTAADERIALFQMH